VGAGHQYDLARDPGAVAGIRVVECCPELRASSFKVHGPTVNISNAAPEGCDYRTWRSHLCHRPVERTVPALVLAGMARLARIRRNVLIDRRRGGSVAGRRAFRRRPQWLRGQSEANQGRN